MPVSNKGGASNHWLTLEPDYEPPQQAEDVPEVDETASDEQLDAQVKQPRKRVTRVSKDA